MSKKDNRIDKVINELNGIKLLDLIHHKKYLDNINSEVLKEIETEEENNPTILKYNGEHEKINDDYDLIALGFDYIVIINNSEIEGIFNVYDLESYWYDEDLNCIIARGHETIHHYILHNKKYKKAYTR